MEEDMEDQLLEDEEPADDLSVKASRQKVSLLYAWGKNKNGELSLGTPKSAVEPQVLRVSVGYARQISSGYKHSALVSSDGLLYVTGELLHGKLGLDKEVTNIFRFQIQPHLQSMKVKQVACGSYHTLALIENGDVYSWGGTLWGKTGQKSGRVSQVHILAPHRIVEIACGDSHSVALSEKGDVFSWGGGGANKNKGQLGHSNYKDLENPQQIQFFKGKKLKAIACGDYHTMGLTEDAELYAWGEGICGQLGTGGKEDLHTPKRINIKFDNNLLLDDYFSRDSGKEKPRVDKFALGGKHSLILTNKGHMYVCGFGSQGQLGIGKTENVFEPTLVSSLVGKRIIMVAAGGAHSMALTDKSNVYSCGHNADGQLGLGDEKSRVVWTHVTALAGKRASRIYAGSSHSWAVLDQNRPIIEDYEPPSPIKVGNNNSQDMGRSNEIPRVDNRSAVSNLTFIETLEELNQQPTISHVPKSVLEVIYTDVDMHHRFIRFTSKDQLKVGQAVQQFLNYCYEQEKNHLKFDRIQHDSDLYDKDGNVIAEADRKACTIMLVSDYSDTPNKENMKSDNRVSIPIGEMAVLKQHQLKVDGRIPLHYRWFFKFGELFDGLVDRTRILQLRPRTS